jgi:hypothetical protein
MAIILMIILKETISAYWAITFAILGHSEYSLCHCVANRLSYQASKRFSKSFQLLKDVKRRKKSL